MSGDYDRGDDGLNGRQRVFVAEYVRDLNATRAALRAGYASASAASQALEPLDNRIHSLISRGLFDDAHEHEPQPELSAQPARDPRCSQRGRRLVDATDDRTNHQRLPSIAFSEPCGVRPAQLSGAVPISHAEWTPCGRRRGVLPRSE